MPMMKLACTALERVPLTRNKVTENLMTKFHQDLVFCRAPGDSELTRRVYGESSNLLFHMPRVVSTRLG